MKRIILIITLLLMIKASFACVNQPTLEIAGDVYIYSNNAGSFKDNILSKHELSLEEQDIIMNYLINGYSVKQTNTKDYEGLLIEATNINNNEQDCRLYRAVSLNSSYAGFIIDRKVNAYCPNTNTELLCATSGYNAYSNDLQYVNPQKILYGLLGFGIVVLLCVITFFWFRKR